MPTFTDDRIQKILRGKRQIGRARFPGSTDDAPVEVGFVMLAEREMDAARFEAMTHVENLARKSAFRDGKLVLDMDPDLLDREVMRQILFRSCVDPDSSDPDKPVPFFQDPSQVRALDPVTVRRLHDCFMDWQEAVSPSLTLDEKGVKDLVATLKKTPESRAILAQFAPEVLHSLVRTLVDLLPS